MKCPNCQTELYDDLTGVVRCRTCPFNTAPLTKRMTQMHAWLAVDKETGNEGFMAVQVDGGLVMPMVHSEERVIRDMREHAVNAAKAGVKIRLVRFDHVTVLEEIGDGDKPRKL